MITAAAHNAPNGIVTWTLAIATLALMVALAYGLRALRGGRPEGSGEREPAGRVPVIRARDTKPYEGNGVSVADDDEECQ